MEGNVCITTDDACELERVLRDVQDQQRMIRPKHEGYGRELVPFFTPGEDVVNSDLITFPKKSNKDGKVRTKKEDVATDSNRESIDVGKKKKGSTVGNGTKSSTSVNNVVGGKAQNGQKKGPAFAGPAFSQSPDPECLPLPTMALLRGTWSVHEQKKGTLTRPRREGEAGNVTNRKEDHADLSMELKSILQVGV